MRPKGPPALTRLSSKGQLVIPAAVRHRLGIRPGNIFAVLTPKKGGLLVLKKIHSKALRPDLEALRDVDRAWKEILRGQARQASRRGFLEELKTW